MHKLKARFAVNNWVIITCPPLQLHIIDKTMNPNTVLKSIIRSQIWIVIVSNLP